MLLGPCVDGAPAQVGCGSGALPDEGRGSGLHTEQRGQARPAGPGPGGPSTPQPRLPWGQRGGGCPQPAAARAPRPRPPCHGEGPPKSSSFPGQLGDFQIQTCLWLLVTQEAEWPGPWAPVSCRGGSHLSSFLRCTGQSVSIALPHSFLLFSFWGSAGATIPHHHLCPKVQWSQIPEGVDTARLEWGWEWANLPD